MASPSSTQSPPKSATPPDLMNDPAYDRNAPQGQERGPDDPDTCRICRGEGSSDEPLFYPCKCSGSIKFVHQDCLMEWLSHSQKKYCELCKTPFRFTKLYSPHMPKKLPTSVFLQKAVMHLISHLLIWLRGLLVGSVWLLGLPWMMRYAWRIMFWIGDAGWARDNRIDLVAELFGGSHSVSPTANESVGLSESLNRSTSAFPSFLNITSQTLNVTRGEPLLFKLVKAIAKSMYSPLRRSELLTGAENNATVDPLLLRMAIQKQSSILSEVRFLKHLTASHTFNRLIIDILEGQIITLSVVIACILIFLIREWVLQQQPVVDIGAADADNALAQAGGGAQDHAHNHAQDDTGAERDGAVEELGGDAQTDNPGELDRLDTEGTTQEGNESLETNERTQNQSDSQHLGISLQTLTEAKEHLDLAEQHFKHLPDEVRQALLDQRPVLEEISKLKSELARIEGIISSLHTEIEQTSQNEKRDTEILATAANELSEWTKHNGKIGKKSQGGEAVSVMSNDTEHGFSAKQDEKKTTVGAAFLDANVTKASGSSSLLTTLPQRPHMPARGQSFLATDIERDIEERSLDGRVPDVGSEGQNIISVEDEQRSQDSTGSWQHVSKSESGPVSAVKNSDDRPSQTENSTNRSSPQPTSTISFDSAPHFSEEKGKERVRTSSPHLADAVSPASPAEPSPTEVHEGSADVRDDISWVSTVGSNESHAHDKLGLGDNPFASEIDEPASETVQEPAGPYPELPGNTSHDNTLPAQPPLVRQITLRDHVYDWFWGDITPEQATGAQLGDTEEGDDEHVVEDLADEAPFVPFAQAQPLAGAHQPAPDPALNPEPAAGAPLAGIDPNDPDAIEDAEDLEGILELIGMQGPIIGLFQNAVFSAVLILISVVACVWVPYMYGKLVLLNVAEPELLYRVPLKMGTIVADFFIDFFLILGGYVAYFVAELYRICMSLFYIDVTPRWTYKVIALPAQRVGQAALQRLIGGVASTNDLEAKDFLYLSMGCHASLYIIRDSISSTVRSVVDGAIAMSHGVSSVTHETLPDILTQLPLTIMEFLISIYSTLASAISTFWMTGSLSIPLGEPIVFPEDPMLAYWSATDRTLAVFAGYAAVALVSAIYLKFAPITSSPKGRRIESHIIEFCQQAGGVLKVILIISIEMIAFPLFCGFLLDFALMPLFESATFGSRVAFAIASPWTSGFVHWFVGTCYMFHFALFVSMCRRIMRSGVLYFIRDPDDPTFHPVRDVLERNVITQLRKIAFSAIVYGALIVVCLGGVVWGLWCVSDSVLPIHWTSSESALEFPLDILFYNFLTPIIVRFARPSDGLHEMYTWWFRKCARVLRLSDFLFRETHKDEQGHYVRRTWKAWATRQTVDVEGSHSHEQEDENAEAFFKPDGRHVRAPASDQVRIPKGTPVFVEVDENDHRLDDKPDNEGVHSSTSTMTAKVYIPPWFRVRISLFVVAVWLFAAATGICVTIVPLLFGRKLLSTAVPDANNVNDIYAFSLGIYILGGLLYTALHYKTVLSFLHHTLWPSSATRAQAFNTLQTYTKRTASLVYVYSSLAVGLPLLFAVLLELYVLMPVHVIFGPEESHVIHLIQDWTLGILYVRIGTRILMWDRQSRAARAVQAVVRDGYLNPSAKLATRAFILPALLAFSILLGTPFLAATVVNATYFRNATMDEKSRVMRLSYPVALGAATSLWVVFVLSKATERWRSRIRDEVYLIGERLHNFGEKKPGPGPVTTRSLEKARAQG